MTAVKNWLGPKGKNGVAALVMLGVMTILSLILVTGRGQGFVRSLLSVARAVSNSRAVTGDSQGKLTNVIFLHHSVGRNLIEQGHVREKLAAVGYRFWDHDYNDPGLRDPAGSFTGYSYSVPDDNTDPDGLTRIFSQPVYPLPFNTLSGLLQHEVIVFKSCFPNSNITSEAQLEQDKTLYLRMRAVMERHSDKIFIVVTQPPLNPAETTPEAAARARALASWLTSEFPGGRPNIVAFDLFGYLAEDNRSSSDYNMLRVDYRRGADSHPNQLANEKVAPILVDFVISAIEHYRNTYNSR